MLTHTFHLRILNRFSGVTTSLLIAASFLINCTAFADELQTKSLIIKSAPVEAYGALPAARMARLSPNGKTLALIVPVNGRDSLVIWDLSGKEKSKVISTGEFQPQWFVWKSDHRLIASLRFFSLRDPEHATADTRLISIDENGNNPVVLVKPEQFLMYIPQIQDKIVSLLPEDENHILIELPAIDRTQMRPSQTSGISRYGSIESKLKYPEVVRVDINTGRLQTATRQRSNIVHWHTDYVGNVRLGFSIKDTTQYYEVKNLNDDSWTKIQSFTVNKGKVFRPIAFDGANQNRLYAVSNHEGGNIGLYEFDVPSDSFVRTISVSSKGDIVPIAKNGKLLGYYLPDQAAPIFIDKSWERDAKIISRALPASRYEIIDVSKEGKRTLFELKKGNEPEAFWLLDKTGDKNVLISIAESYPDIQPEQIASTNIVSFNARDELKIPALLTLPINYKKDSATTLPFVVLPHGGPTSQDETGFDYLVQFLASRGYGVLQPQFRGSTGFGAAFETAGLQQWGLRMQDDVTDGTNWLIQQKLADPTRIAIVGASYGGYSALMGAVKEPALYRCAVAIAPVTDLNKLLDSIDNFLFSDINIPRIGTNKALLEQTSPALNADKIRIPLLLVHGKKDYTVPVIHTELMAGALRKASKPYEVVYLDDGDHYLSRGSDRLSTLKALERFLEINLTVSK